jgi:hypothetical protein
MHAKDCMDSTMTLIRFQSGCNVALGKHSSYCWALGTLDLAEEWIIVSSHLDFYCRIDTTEAEEIMEPQKQKK